MSEILFIAHRIPYPPDRGDKIRSWHILKTIARHATVHVAAPLEHEGDRAFVPKISEIAASVTVELRDTSKTSAIARALASGLPASVAAFDCAALRRAVANILDQRPISCIYAYSGQMALYVPKGFRGRFVMDFVDMDSAKFEAYGGFANRQEAKRLFAFERETARRADLSLFVSEAEADVFRTATGLGADRVQALDNGIDLEAFDPALPRKTVRERAQPLIVFTGQMDYRPNIEAVSAFAREAMPIVRARIPDACFAIVGRAPTPEVMALAALPGVMVTGEVADTRDWLAAAQVVVAPLRMARGIQNKVLEAMAMAKPVIVSPAAAEGIDAVPGEHFVLADGGPAEAEAVRVLLGDPAKAREIGTAARARMIARYGWDAQLARLPEMLGLGQ